jgi:hypothetical protein
MITWLSEIVPYVETSVSDDSYPIALIASSSTVGCADTGPVSINGHTKIRLCLG